MNNYKNYKKKPHLFPNIIKLQTENRQAQTPSHTDGNYHLLEMHLTKIYVLIHLIREHPRFVWWKKNSGLKMEASACEMLARGMFWIESISRQFSVIRKRPTLLVVKSPSG